MKRTEYLSTLIEALTQKTSPLKKSNIPVSNVHKNIVNYNLNITWQFEQRLLGVVGAKGVGGGGEHN